MSDSSLDRRSTMSWPSILVIMLASWGILKTSPSVISRRPRVKTVELRTTSGPQNVPARLWQDPLGIVYRLETSPGTNYEPARLDDVFKAQGVRQNSVLFLTVLLPGNNYAEDAEQCRRHRYAVMSALGRADFAPQRSAAIGYTEFCRCQDQCAGGRCSRAEGSHRPLVVPFEWFERKSDSQLIFLHWVDESQLRSPLLDDMAIVRDRMKTAAHRTLFRDHAADAREELFHHAVLGPVSSTTLLHMQQAKANRSGSGMLPGTTFYSTQSTADECRQDADVRPSPRIQHLIGTDRQLADEIVTELTKRRGVNARHSVALFAEWDTDYGRDMIATFRDAFGARVKSVSTIKYLRGLDGQLSGALPTEDALASTDEASGLSQIDYIRRTVDQLKNSDQPPSAIGVLGSDVYDKLLLLRVLRHEFPTASLFTTDVDDRLLHRGEYRSTHNLLIATHYNLSLHKDLQGGVPPFRSTYQTSQFLGTLVILKDQELLEGHDVSLVVESAQRELEGGGAAVLLYEVGRKGAFNLNQVGSDRLHGDDDRRTGTLRPQAWILLVVGLMISLAFLLIFQRVQEFVYAAWRREFDWRHWLTFVIAITALGTAWLIWREHLSREGEPFALYEGISIWPTICWRLFLVGFCTYSIIRADIELTRSYEELSRSELGIEPPWSHVPWRVETKQIRKAFRSKHFRSWWLANAFSGCDIRRRGTFEPRFSTSGWRRYGRRSQLGSQQLRLLPYVLLFVTLAVLMVCFLGAATSPARGVWSWRINFIIYTASGISILWLIFYVLDSIRLCSRWVEQSTCGTARWPDSVLRRAVDRFATPDNRTFRRILGLLLDVRLVARRTELVSRLVYAPCVALLVGFVARHPVFDNWTWSPQVSIPFGVSLLITFYSATVLGRSSIRAKDQAVRAVEQLISSMPWQSVYRTHAEALLRELRSIEGGAMVPLRRNPVVAAVLLPFGSLSSVYLLEFVLEHMAR